MAKLQPLAGNHSKGCLNCGPLTVTLPLTAILEVGFGDVAVTKNQKEVWSCYDHKSPETGFCEKTAQVAEDMARKDPDADWRIIFNAPLYSAVYQRHGQDEWNLVEKGEGFA